MTEQEKLDFLIWEVGATISFARSEGYRRLRKQVKEEYIDAVKLHFTKKGHEVIEVGPDTLLFDWGGK